jgi:hypothetical protein
VGRYVWGKGPGEYAYIRRKADETA